MESADVGLLFPPPPVVVWVGAKEYRVTPVHAKHPKLDGDARGICYREPTEIFYDHERPAREQFEVIWHELTHAVNEEFALQQPRKRITEERIASIHGHAWTQVLLDNPRLIEWLDLATNFIKSEQESIET